MPGQHIPFWMLQEPQSVSGFVQPAELVVETSEDFAAIWATLYSNRTGAPAVPLIDFNKEVVLVLAVGGRISGGYAIINPRLEYTNQSVRVDYVIMGPGAGCVVPATLTSPAVVLRLARQALPFEFQSRTYTRDCSTPH